MLHKFNRYLSNASSWLVIGMSCFLAIVVVGQEFTANNLK